jgi:DNA modification methylase
MISAFLEGRGFVGSELQQKYYDLAVSRFKNYTDFSSENQVKSRPFGKVATA